MDELKCRPGFANRAQYQELRGISRKLRAGQSVNRKGPINPVSFLSCRGL